MGFVLVHTNKGSVVQDVLLVPQTADEQAVPSEGGPSSASASTSATASVSARAANPAASECLVKPVDQPLGNESE